MSGRSKKTDGDPQKPVGRRVTAAYTELMRKMGSPNGIWNPDPDEQITGLLRRDVDPCSNEIKFVALVKACCIRDKPGGRTEWGKTDRGEALIEARISDYFGWDPANTSRYAARLRAWGLVRVNPDGVYGLGASVQGIYKEGPEGRERVCPTCGRTLGEVEKCIVCTYNIPEYAFVAAKGLGEISFKNFLQGWVTRKERELERIAEETKRLRQEAFDDRKSFCQGFGIELKTAEKNGAKSSPEKSRKKAGESAPDLSVQTTSDELSVQTRGPMVYNAPPGGVQRKNGAPIKERREEEPRVSANPSESKPSESSSSSQQERPDTTTTDEKAFLKRVRTELARHGTLDQEILFDFVARCRAKSADCTAEEIEHFIEVKAKLIPKDVQNPIAWLRTAVSRCFEPESLAEYRSAHRRAAPETAAPTVTPEQHMALLEEWISGNPHHEQLAEWQGALDVLRKQRRADAKAQRAGQP